MTENIRFSVGGDAYSRFNIIKDNKTQTTYRFRRICLADLRQLAKLLNDVVGD